MRNRHPVFVGEQRYGAEFQTLPEFEKGWQSVLRRAYQAGQALCSVRCGCRSQLERPLYISLREGVYHLSRWPGMGSHHARDCRYYSHDRERSGLQCYADGVVKESADGFIHINLANGLAGGANNPRQQLHNLVACGSRHKQAAISILGLLHLIWQESDLNVWHPRMDGRRSFWVIAEHALRAAHRIGNAKGNVGDVMITPAEAHSPQADRNRAIVEAAHAQGKRVFLLGVLARYRTDLDTDLADSPRFAKPFGWPQLYLGDALLERLNQSHAREIAAWKDGHRVVVLVQAEVKKAMKSGRLYCRALAAGMMEVTAQWIPVESSHERVLEGHLREQTRSFQKPLRFDSGNEEVFPDFWLLDRGEPVPVEVFGMDTPEYNERRRIKTEHYDKHFPGRWVIWDAVAGAELPKLP